MDTKVLAQRLKHLEDCQDMNQQQQAVDALNRELVPDGLFVYVERVDDEYDQYSVRIADWQLPERK